MNISPDEIITMDPLQIAKLALELAKKRRDLVQQAYAITQRTETEASTMKSFEADAAIAIANETNTAGKPMYSNAEARAAELAIRLKENESYMAAKNAVHDGRAEAFVRTSDADHLKDVIRILMAFFGTSGQIGF